MTELIDATACRRLWCDVFLASINDAWNDPLDRWIATRDYFTVSALAGIEHDAARDLAAALRARHARLRGDGSDGGRQAKELPMGILRAAPPPASGPSGPLAYAGGGGAQVF